MEIGPVSSKQPLERPQSGGEATPKNNLAPKPDQDQVIISSEARARLADLADRRLSTDRAETGPVNPANDNRLDIIRSRIESGFYDQPEVRAEMADKLINGLGFQADQE